MKEQLKLIASTLNQESITWGVGASYVLLSYGLVDEVHDIDLIVAVDEIQKSIAALETIGEHTIIPKKDEYHTKHFHVFEIQGVSVDVMSGFRIEHEAGIYEFPFDGSSITRVLDLDGEKVPLSSLEDWLVAYDLMIGREKKVKLIKDYLIKEGVSHPKLLERVMKQELPESTIQLIQEVMT